jgi:hypothetical protein
MASVLSEFQDDFFDGPVPVGCCESRFWLIYDDIISPSISGNQIEANIG